MSIAAEWKATSPIGEYTEYRYANTGLNDAVYTRNADGSHAVEVTHPNAGQGFTGGAEGYGKITDGMAVGKNAFIPSNVVLASSGSVLKFSADMLNFPAQYVQKHEQRIFAGRALCRWFQRGEAPVGLCG